jgi:IS5 family transposase
MEILPVFCEIDDFCKVFEKLYQRRALPGAKRRRNRATRLSQSEVMTILVMYHGSGYKNLKAFYLEEIIQHYRAEFRALVSYRRFVQLQARCVLPLYFYLLAKRGKSTGISFIDATALKVCHNLRIPSHKVFGGSAERDKSSTGWYYGFKLHLAINESGEILGFYLTAANVDERMTADWITQNLTGKLIGDKGYISQSLFEILMSRGLQLITKLRKNMKNRFVSMEDKILLRKRALIETVNDQLKNISNIEHTRHRSLWNFLGNVAAGLIAYSWKEKKPSLNLNFKQTVSAIVL